ncbi:MAG: hypothetical protein GTO24_21290 [candidate division Zixibacteria bacterium]|nr:hypothetical protein [candidate division Zixibacteria bacterium]
MTSNQHGVLIPHDNLTKIVAIHWQDSIQYSDHTVWKPTSYVRHMAKVLAPIQHVSVGIVIDETDEYILFTHSHRADGHCAASMSIPKRQITNIVTLYEEKKDAKRG